MIVENKSLVVYLHVMLLAAIKIKTHKHPRNLIELNHHDQLWKTSRRRSITLKWIIVNAW